MSWERSIKEFKNYLRIEKSLSENTISSYLSDINKLADFAKEKNLTEIQITKLEIKEFIIYINKVKMSA